MNWVYNGIYIIQVNSTYVEHYVCTIWDTPDWDREESQSILVTDK
jgi:hypothetical protein